MSSKVEDWEIDLPQVAPPPTMKLMERWGGDRFIEGLDRPAAFDTIQGEMPPGVADVLCADLLLGDVMNGSFHQYFHNSFGVTIERAISAMRKLDLLKHADAAEAALAVFGPNFPRDRRQRMDRMDELPETAFDTVTDQFHVAEDDHATGMNATLQREAIRLLSENA
ncbi:DMP19 family protein [Mesorhizobium sp. CA10]|nr:DMP19 family protein [Mesorhizobium sp. CA10]